MTPKELERVRRQLPACPTPFPYEKDDFALHLMRRAAKPRATRGGLRRSPFGRLMDRPRVRTALERRCDGRIEAGDFVPSALDEGDAFTLTWDQWGHDSRRVWRRGWHQMARRGFNLVVQLNLPRDHLRHYRRLVRPRKRHPFQCSDHPIARGRSLTLAWARIDLDLDSGEALIEELQSDWVREAAEAGAAGRKLTGTRGTPDQLYIYAQQILAPLAAIWAEALLAAVLWVLLEPLRIPDIYLYDYETGNLAKTGRPSGRTGPQSLYSDLPRKFCFRKVTEAPRFLTRVFEADLEALFTARAPLFWRLPEPR